MNIERRYDTTSNTNAIDLINNQFIDNFIHNYLNELYNKVEMNLTTSNLKEVV